MGFLTRIKNGLIRLMYGRNGMDQLNIFLVWVGIILTILSSFVAHHVTWAGNILYTLSQVLLILALFRMFSKNLYKRRSENSSFMSVFAGYRRRKQMRAQQKADTAHKYFTCKHCKTVCRVPVGKGKIEITCPKCGTKIHAKT